MAIHPVTHGNNTYFDSMQIHPKMLEHFKKFPWIKSECVPNTPILSWINPEIHPINHICKQPGWQKMYPSINCHCNPASSFHFLPTINNQ
eukprot:14402190-Ditylum_brightwellii.AAC.1